MASERPPWTRKAGLRWFLRRMEAQGLAQGRKTGAENRGQDRGTQHRGTKITSLFPTRLEELHGLPVDRSQMVTKASSPVQSGLARL